MIPYKTEIEIDGEEIKKVVLDEGNIYSTLDGFYILFGDVVGDAEKINDEIYNDIINRCNEKNWTAWEEALKRWKKEGLLN